jgi:hypothetical protein
MFRIIFIICLCVCLQARLFVISSSLLFERSSDPFSFSGTMRPSPAPKSCQRPRPTKPTSLSSQIPLQRALPVSTSAASSSTRSATPSRPSRAPRPSSRRTSAKGSPFLASFPLFSILYSFSSLIAFSSSHLSSKPTLNLFFPSSSST